MTDYDASSGLLDDDETIYALSHKADAQLDHDYGDSEDPLEGLDAESLASFNLRRLRKELGLSQQQIADRIAAHRPSGQKLSQTQIAKIERGERPWRVNEMMWIAGALGVRSDEFFRVTPDEDYSRLEIESARLRLEQAKALAEEARDAWRTAAKREYEREEEFLQVAAGYGIQSVEAMHVLEMRWYHQDWVKDALEGKMAAAGTLAERQAKAREFAEAQWNNRVQQAQEESEQGEPDE